MPSATDKHGNRTISSFFSPKARQSDETAATSTPASRSEDDSPSNKSRPIVVIDDGDAEPPSKRFKLGSGDNDRNTSKSKEATEAGPSTKDKLKQWSYSDSSQADPSGEPSSGPDLKRREAFRKKLLGDSSVLNRRKLQEEDTQTGSADEGREGDSLDATEDARMEVDGEASDGEEMQGESEDDGQAKDGPGPSTLARLQQFTATPAPTAKGKGRSSKAGETQTTAKASRKSSSEAKGKGKAAEKEVGPSGKTYTPLEEQVRELKRKYPGVLLIVEVGYKFRFFGDDARVASQHLNIVSPLLT